jgi:hypothetical protein
MPILVFPLPVLASQSPPFFSLGSDNLLCDKGEKVIFEFFLFLRVKFI